MAITAKLPPGSAHSRLVASIREVNKIFAEDPALARVFTARWPSGPVGVVSAAEEPPRALDWAGREFASGLAAGEFQSDRSPDDLAQIYAGIVNTFHSLALSKYSAITLEEVPDLVDRHFLQTLKPEREIE